jgi:aminopeptidase C
MNTLKNFEILPEGPRYLILSNFSIDELIEASNKYEQIDKYFRDEYFLEYYIEQNRETLTFNDVEYLLNLFSEIQSERIVTS